MVFINKAEATVTSAFYLIKTQSTKGHCEERSGCEPKPKQTQGFLTLIGTGSAISQLSREIATPACPAFVPQGGVSRRQAKRFRV